MNGDGVGGFEFELAVSQGGELLGVEIDDADAGVEGVGDEKAIVGVEGEVVHSVETALGGGAAVPFGNVPEFVSSRGFAACDEIELSVLKAEDAIALFVFDSVERAFLVEDDREGFGEAGDFLGGSGERGEGDRQEKGQELHVMFHYGREREKMTAKMSEDSWLTMRR